MAWNNVPQATQRINETQPLIQANFANLQTEYSINHVALQAGADQGKHIKLDVTNKATHDAVSATDVLLYNFLNVTTGIQELYFKRTGILGTAGTPITAGSMVNRWTYLPSGLLVKWGASDKNGLGTVNINWGPDFDGVTDPTAFVMNKWTGATANSYARFVSITTAAQPVLSVWCSLMTAPTTASQAYFNFIIIGV